MGKIISISGQKGGCGKTTVSVILASMLAYKYGKKVMVIDADTSQQSFHMIRLDDQTTIQPYETGEKDESGEAILEVENFEIYEEFSNRGIPAYPVVECRLNVDEIINVLEKSIDDYDFILLDMPGNVDNNEYFQIIQNADVVFVPFVVNRLDFKSNFPFAKVMYDELYDKEDTRLKKMYYFWFKFDSKARLNLYNEYKEDIKNGMPNMEELENKIGNTPAALNPKLFNTLIAPIGKFREYGNVANTVDEMCKKIM